MKNIFTDRSRTECYQHCARERYLRYHAGDGIGLEPAKKPLPLAVGGAVHRGLETLLRWSMTRSLDSFDEWRPLAEDAAVCEAVTDLAQYKSALALPDMEADAMAKRPATITADASFESQLEAQARDLGMAIEDVMALRGARTPQPGAGEFDEWLWKEQSGLVEGMVRAYARRRLLPLLTEFEVLEVEREGEWELAHRDDDVEAGVFEGYDIVFMSRPDALLRSRADNSLYLLSYKTAASWDRRKELDAQHDAQGLSEGVEVERRLGEWWAAMHTDKEINVDAARDLNNNALRTWEWLRDLPAPPRILGIRYEYLLKGERWKDKDLSARFGFDVRHQRSPLCRRYVAVSLPKKGESRHRLGDWCASFDFLNDDGTEGKLYYGHWRSESVDDIPAWIAALDDSEEAMSAEDSTVGLAPRSLGWKSRAQAVGYLSQHPLDAVFVPPITVYRNQDDLYDWLESTEAQERKVAEAVAQVAAAQDESERRSLLNVHFPLTRRACSYPVQCDMLKICYSGEEMRRDPLASGLYKPRTPHHTPEVVSVAGRGDAAQ